MSSTVAQSRPEAGTRRRYGKMRNRGRTCVAAICIAAVVGAAGCSEYALESAAPSGGLYDGVIAQFGETKGTSDSTGGADGKSGAILDGKLDGKLDGEIDASPEALPDAWAQAAEILGRGDNADEAGPGSAADEEDSDTAADPGDPGPACDIAPCVVDADCPIDPEADPCASVACLDGCCQKATAPDASPCDDGNACTAGDTCLGGVCTGSDLPCDDGLQCTEDTCAAATGTCQSTVAIGYCAIDGSCYGKDEVHAASPCKVCQPSLSSLAWSDKPGCCTVDSQCPPGGICDSPICNALTGKCGFQKKLGCCEADVDCDDGSACTTDTCDLAVGSCKIVPKFCAAPSNCQKGACNPATGACEAETKPGWCFVEGACRMAGETSGDNPCLVCTPALDPAGWTSNTGTLCDDGDDCTVSDACTAAAICKGTDQQGCCKVDSDCPVAADPCQTSKCNKLVGLCTVSPKAGCCAAGACCDLGANAIQPQGVACSATVLSTEYQCSGQKIQKRETKPGCNGTDAEGCTSNPAYSAIGAWVDVQACGTGTACKEVGSGKMPQCQPTGPVGTCQGACGGKTLTPNGTCYCDSACTGLGDCCSDFMGLCGCSGGECCDVAASFPKAKGTPCGSAKTQFQCSGAAVQKRTGQPTCNGSNACSTSDSDLLWGGWATVETCSGGATCQVQGGGASAVCKSPMTGSCMGKCGGKSAGTCWCDSACKSLGDCCADFDTYACSGVTVCGSKATSTCDGQCGSSGTGACWCDAICETIGDCCGDKTICGC